MKPHLLLLHGALGSARALQPLARELSPFCQVHSFSFSGHGGRPVVPGEFSMDHFAGEVTDYIRQHQLPAAHVFGFSMGGYAALLSALRAPSLIRSVTTLGTKFDWNPATLAAETRLLDAAKIQEKVPQFAAELARTHAPTSWPAVLEATAGLLTGLAAAPPLTAGSLAHVGIPVQVLVGELDKTAGVDASREYAGYLPRATCEVIQNTPHPLERVNPDLLASRILALINATEAE